MKKNIMIIVYALMLSFVSTMVFAGNTAAPAPADAGNPITILGTSATCPGPSLTFTPSPATLISASTSGTAFTITSASGKTTTANGIEYGILSSRNQMYQRIQTTDNDVTDTASAIALPGTDWKDKAGNSAS